MHTNCPVYIPVLIILIGFGIGYNRLVERLESGGHDRGYMGLIVAFGCAVTIAGAAFLIGFEDAGWTFLCFVASGTPMIIGSIERHCRTRTRQQRDCLDHNHKIIQREE